MADAKPNLNSSKQWKLTSVYLNSLAIDLQGWATTLRELSVHTQSDQSALREVIEELFAEGRRLSGFLSALERGGDPMEEDDGFLAELLVYQEVLDEEYAAAQDSLPTELQREIDRDLGYYEDDERYR